MRLARGVPAAMSVNVLGRSCGAHGQRLIDAVTARREHDLGDGLLEFFDFVGDGSVAGNGVVDRMQLVGLDRLLVAVQGDHQFAEIFVHTSRSERRACGR